MDDQEYEKAEIFYVELDTPIWLEKLSSKPPKTVLNMFTFVLFELM